MVRDLQMDEEFTNEFDWEGTETVSMTVIETVSAVTGTEPTEMRPLNKVVDTDAIEMLFAPTSSGPRGPGKIQFVYEECLVTITSAGVVSVSPAKATDF